MFLLRKLGVWGVGFRAFSLRLLSLSNVNFFSYSTMPARKMLNVTLYWRPKHSNANLLFKVLGLKRRVSFVKLLGHNVRRF